MATSGSLDTVTFDAAEVIEQAFLACRIEMQMVTGEMLLNARKTLDLMLASLPHSVTSAWTREAKIVPVVAGQKTYSMPVGTARVVSVNWRTLNRLTGTLVSSDAQDATALMDTDAATYVQHAAGGGSFTCTFDDVYTVSCVGIMPTADDDGTVNVYTSANGSTWTLRTTITGGFKAYQFAWVDLDPTINTQYVKIEGASNFQLSLAEWFICSSYQEVPIQAIPMDQYYSLPNRTTQANQPNLYWQQRTAAGPVLHVWPAPSVTASFGCMNVIRDRAVEDVGDLINTLEVPKIWLEAVIMGLAYRIALKEPKVDVGIVNVLKPMADDFQRLAMRADGDGTGWQMAFQLQGYTR